MIPIRLGSAIPVVTAKSTVAATSSIAPFRSAPSSRPTKRRPKPDEPRTFGARTEIPAATRAW